MSLKEIITVVGPIASIATVAVGAVGASTYAYIHTRRSKNTPSPEISTSQQESEANKALKLKPQNAADYGRRGTSYYQLRDYQKALQDFDSMIRLNPKRAEISGAYSSRGEAYAALKQHQQAIQDFDRALVLNPQNALIYASRGNVYFDLKDYQHAIQDFDNALALHPDDTSAHYNRAIAYLWQNNIEHARADFTRTWELDATDIEAVWMTAWSSMCQEIPRTSIIECLETIAVIDSQHYLAQISKAVILYLNKNYHEALTVLEHAISILVHNDQPLIQLREMIS